LPKATSADFLRDVQLLRPLTSPRVRQ